MELFDAYGRVVRTEKLDEVLAAPVLSGVRHVWANIIAPGLTPHRLTTLLQSAAQGSHDHYLVLAEEMEERDPHYASVLGTRKRALSGLPMVVEAASDDPEDVRIAEAVRDMVKHPCVRQCVTHLLDALGKGYSVCEIVWDMSGLPWVPKNIIWRDPRFFLFDQLDRETIRLRDEEDPALGLLLEPFKFITHNPQLKNGIPIRGGLARLSGWSYLFKNYTVKSWMGFMDVFGQPMRLGKYAKNHTDEDKQVLLTALANLGSDAAAMVPEGMEILFEQLSNVTGGQLLFKNAAEWFDQQLSKAILGQTMTADQGSSLSQAQVHNDVRGDILMADSVAMTDTLNRDLIIPFVQLNFGVQKNYPRLTIPVLEPEDTVALADALSKLVPLGLKVRAQQVRDKFGLDDPAPDDELLVTPATVTLDPTPDAAANFQRYMERLAHPLHRVAINRDELDIETDIDDIEDPALADWQEHLSPLFIHLQALLDRSTSYEDVSAGLADLLETFDNGPDQRLIDSLADTMFRARGLGDQGDGD